MMRSLLAGLLTLTSPVLAAQDEDVKAHANWPQWRGPSRNGVAGARNLPTEWGPDEHLLFKTAIHGRGHSSPIVWGERIFVSTDIEGDVIPGARAPEHIRAGEVYLHPASQSADRSHRLEVICLDAATGEILWRRKTFEGRVFDNRHRDNTYASPTGITDGEHVYFYFGSQGLFAFDFEGTLVWSVDFGDILTWGHGHGTSPLLHGGKLVLQIDQDEGDGSFLVALDKKTGEEIWRTPRRERINYSSPILLERPGGAEIVTTSYENVISYDADTGRTLWKSAGFLGNAVPTAVASEAMVFAVSGYPDKLTRAIRIPERGSEGQSVDATVAWEYRKGTGYVPSPLLYGGYLYLVSDKGILTCIVPETGEIVYEGGRVPVPTLVKASPVAWEDKILLAGDAGDVFVVRAGPNHEILASSSLDETIVASPAIASGRIYVRTEHHLYAFGFR